MSAAMRAELFAVRRRPAAWLIGGYYLLSLLVFGVGATYIVYRTAPDTATTPPEQLLPDRAVATVLGGLPLFGVAAMVVLGAVVVGGDLRWGTLTTVLTQGPSRVRTMAAKLVALGLVLVGLVLAAVVVVVLAGVVIATVHGEPVQLPSLGPLVSGVAATWLVALAAAGLGAALAVVLRGIAAAIAVGLIWVMAVEGAVLALASASPVLEGLRTVLLGASASSLAKSVGAPGQVDGGSPFVMSGADPAVAGAVLAGYVVLSAAAVLITARRRDVT